MLAGHPVKTNHRLRPLAEKATADDPSKRYQDAAELLNAIRRKLALLADADREANLADKATRGILDEDVTEWVLDMTDEQLCTRIVSIPAFANTGCRICKTRQYQRRLCYGCYRPGHDTSL